MQNFYIFEGDKKFGPYDLVSMIKKIRNGKLQSHDSVLPDDLESPVKAHEVKALNEYFLELEYSHEPPAPSYESADDINPITLLGECFGHFGHNTTSSLVALGALGVLAVIGLILIQLLPNAAAVPIISGLFGVLYFLFMIHTYAKQDYDIATSQPFQRLKSKQGIMLLGIAAGSYFFLIGIPLLLWAVIGPFASVLLVLGFLGLSLLLFAPLLWVSDLQEEGSALSHSKRSVKWMLSQQPDTIAKLMTLPALNCVALLLFVFPLAVSLPVTCQAWVYLYQRYVSPK